MKLKILLSLCLLAPRLDASWVEVTNNPVVLQSEVVISYKIDNFDPARFNDIHSLVYAGSELLYAARVSGGEGVIRVPCGVVTHAGVHSISLCYTNNTVIARTKVHVDWPSLAISVPTRIETFTLDVAVSVSFTNNVCGLVSVRGNNNNQRVLRGGKRGLMGVWLQVQRCEGGAGCDQSHLVKIVKLEHFYSALSSSLSLECGDWGVAGLYRLVVGVERDKERNITREDTILATSRTFIVDWSSDYSLSLQRTSLGDCPAGDSVILETDYPGCILARDKVRLYRQSANSLARPQYLGEQRVIQGDKAVVFPCSLFNVSVSRPDTIFCFHYISVARDGAVNTVKSLCLPIQETGNGDDPASVWAPWGAWSGCSVTCGAGARSRYRFCTAATFFCQGPRVESAPCSLPACPSTPSPSQLPSSELSGPPLARPTPVYGASPCGCGCTYILHTAAMASSLAPGDTSRDINIVSGDCHVFPVTWTLKVPSGRHMIVSVQNVSFTCPGLQLNIRDGVETRDTLLYTIHVDTNVSVSVRTSGYVSRLELVSDTWNMNSSLCYAVMHVGVIIKEFSHGELKPLVSSEPGLLRSELSSVLQISTPVLLVVSLMLLIVVCTLVMLCDYQVKRAKYSDWKKTAALSVSRSSSPGPEGDYRQCGLGASMTDISLVSDCDYTPLIQETASVTRSRSRLFVPPVIGSKSVPVTPALSHRRRRLLRRSETVEDYKLRLGDRARSSKRKLSLPQKVSRSKLYTSVSTIDRDDESVKESSDKISDIKSVSTRLKKVTAKRKRLRRSAAESSESDLARTGSEMTLRPSNSRSEFSPAPGSRSGAVTGSEFSSCVSLSGELEYDLYDCHIDNVMAAPGSMFAPAYWDAGDRTPSLDLEMDELFPPTPTGDSVDARESPVMMRRARVQDKGALVTSITSDLTASIGSAVSNTTLVGDSDNIMDISGYHSGDAEDTVDKIVIEKRNIMNLTHIEDEIQFVDD